MRRTNFISTASVIALCSIFGVSGIAAAQEGDADAVPAMDIVVTGSRVVRDGFSAPTPVSVIGAEEIKSRAPTSVADVLNELPAFRATNTPTSSGASTSGAGFNYADLRGLGPVRTLVLVDGRRHVPTAATGQVDLNLIPTILIERAEAVTGGASAAYGSDAVAGVVNLILKSSIKGIQGEVQSGITSRGDGSEFRVALAGGTTFAGDRGRVIIGGEYVDNKAIGDRYSRGWGVRETGLLTNPTPGVNGLPARVIADKVHMSTMNAGGLITSGPLRGLTFEPGGVVRQYDYGTVVGNAMIGGEGYGVNNFQDVLTRAPVERMVAMMRTEFDVSPGLTIFGELSGAQSQTSSFNGYSRDQGSLTIQRDNAFLPDSVYQSMVDLGLNSFSMGRFNLDVGPAQPWVRNRTLRTVVGARGEIGGGWGWDAYYQYGQNQFDNRVANNRLNANFLRAIDAVEGPGGTIICRSTLSNPSDGCVPFNAFGNGAASAAALDYVVGTSQYQLKTRQHVTALNITGSPFSTWAGEVSVAFGAEGRWESADATADALSQANAFHVGNLKPISGDINVKEAYLEAVVPLLRDMALARSLDFNGAVRRTDYSTSGGVTSWKLGLTYEPFADLRLRATRSHDIRAPNISELFSASALGRGAVTNPATLLNPFANIYTLGNPDLKPETANTTSVGFVYTPSWLNGFSASVDFYKIAVGNQISTLGAQGIVDRCFAGAAEYCSLVTIDNSGTITEVFNRQLNLFQYETKGIDFELAYRFGAFSLRGVATHVNELATVDSAGRVNRAGQTGAANGVPKWNLNLGVTYRNGPVTVSGQVRHISKGVYDVTLIGPDEAGYSASLPNSVSNNVVPAVTYANLSVQYDFGRDGGPPVQLFTVVNNLFDQSPPGVPTNAIPTNTAIFDTVGRAFKVGIRFGM